MLDCAPKVVLDAGSQQNNFLLLESALVKKSAEKRNLESLVREARELASQKDPLGDVQMNRQLRKAVKKFTKVEKNLKECNFNGYYTLASNYKAALSCPLLLGAIREAIQRHSDECRQTYLGEFKSKFKRVNKNLVSRIEHLIDRENILESIFSAENKTVATNDRGSIDNLLQNNLWAPIRKIDDLFLTKIVQAVKHTKSGKYFDNISKENPKVTSQIRARIIQKQLVKPCKRFVKEFAEIFYAARLDLAAAEPDDSTKWSQMNPAQDQKFTDIWIRFRVCQAIKEDQAGVLKRISAEAHKRFDEGDAEQTQTKSQT